MKMISASELGVTGDTTWAGNPVYQFQVRQDRFIHFTTARRAMSIVRSKKLLMRSPYRKSGADVVAAISLVWGQYAPRTQTAHIPKDEGPLMGVVFSTSLVPDDSFPEEVIWHQDVPLSDIKVVSFEKGVSMLRSAPQAIGADDMVRYASADRVVRLAASCEDETSWASRLKPHQAKDLLEQQGWVSVANAYSLGTAGSLSPKQWESFLGAVLECWKKNRIRRASPGAVVKLAAAPEKYADIDFKPPASVAAAAKRGLEYRRKASPSNKGGLTPAEAGKQGIGSGVQRAVNLSNRDDISPEVVRQMRGFLSRFKKHSTVSPEHKSEPWNDKGYVAWLLWGGDPAEKWVDSLIEKMEKADAKTKTASRNKTACIIAAGTAGGSRFLLKNRDRNYIPEVKVYHEIRNGVEILYMKDETTGWVEGLNENGIGIVNSALMVGFDEAEKKMVKTVGKKSKDGKVVLEALSQPNLDLAVEVVKTFQGGLKGHTFISDANYGWAVEMTSKHDVVAKRLNMSDLYVRTNHGIEYPDAGYTEGDKLVSSVARREKAIEKLKGVSNVEDVAPTIFGHRLKDHGDGNNMVRDTESMRTVSQMVIDLTKKRAILYLIPGKVRYLGFVSDLPEDYKPKIKFDLYKYTDLDGDGDYDVVKKKPKKPQPADKKASPLRVLNLVSR